jgi:hypothetical protein
MPAVEQRRHRVFRDESAQQGPTAASARESLHDRERRSILCAGQDELRRSSHRKRIERLAARRDQDESVRHRSVEQRDRLAGPNDERLSAHPSSDLRDCSLDVFCRSVFGQVDGQDSITKLREPVRPTPPRIRRGVDFAIVKQQNSRVAGKPSDPGDRFIAVDQNRDRFGQRRRSVQLTPQPSCLYFFAQSTPCQVFIETGLTKKSQRGSVSVGMR